MPSKVFNTFGVRWTFNPGPFNIKEHTVITVEIPRKNTRAFRANLIFRLWQSKNALFLSNTWSNKSNSVSISYAYCTDALLALKAKCMSCISTVDAIELTFTSIIQLGYLLGIPVALRIKQSGYRNSPCWNVPQIPCVVSGTLCRLVLALFNRSQASSDDMADSICQHNLVLRSS